MSDITLPSAASMADYQRYVHQLEELHGWLDVDLVHSGFLMTEEVGELFKAIRRFERLFPEGGSAKDADDASVQQRARADAAEEIVDVLNYLLAIANRLGVDVEQAFRDKNARNQTRSWG